MKINEVEQLVGVTKRNIRYYEQEGLLNPSRDSANGYRNYSDADVETLRQIKLLRKLDLPLEEIRRLQSGALTVQDAMSRHTIQLERKRTNLAAMIAMCQELKSDHAALTSLDVNAYLERMEKQEQEGTAFVNIKKKDTKIKYVAPIIAALVMITLMAAFAALVIWAFTVDGEGVPLGVIVFLLAIPLIIMIGVLAALYQRIKQIKGGEEDAASQY